MGDRQVFRLLVIGSYAVTQATEAWAVIGEFVSNSSERHWLLDRWSERNRVGRGEMGRRRHRRQVVSILR
jgi:hypothetical protein